MRTQLQPGLQELGLNLRRDMPTSVWKELGAITSLTSLDIRFAEEVSKDSDCLC